MKKYAPLATLVSVVLLGAVLLVANMLSTPQATSSPDRTVSAAAAAPASAVPPEPAPAQTAPTEPAPTGAPAPAEAAPAPAVPAPAPAPAPTVAERAYTGRSAGNEVTVGIAVQDGKGVAYVCDGKKVEAWMEGALDGDKLTLQGKTGSLTATVDEKATLGSITVDGIEWPFSAKGLDAPAGLLQDRAAIKRLGARTVQR